MSFQLLLVAVLALLVPAAAGAQGQSGAKQLENIRQRMESGLALFLANKHAEAANTFDAGYAEHPYSAFLFNAGVCYQKLRQDDKALERYREYLRIDPNAPDIEKVQRRIAALEGKRAAPAPTPPPPPKPATDGGDAGDAGTPVEGGSPTPPPPPPPPPPVEDIPDDDSAMRSLIVVETEPHGAPLKVYQRLDAAAKPFTYGQKNDGWKEIIKTVSPTSLSLAEGSYHIAVEKFRDFNVSETPIEVSPGHVYHFKANLSQGVFMSFLRVSANVKGAHVWLDDSKKLKPEWGTTPYGELVPAGEHEVLVEAPGFQPLLTKLTLRHGEQKELEVRMVRVDYGILRIDANTAEARIKVDDQPKGVWKSGEAPLDVQVSAGKHQLTIESDDHKTFEGMVDVPRGQVLPVHAKMIPKYPRGAAWTQAILGAAFIGAGAFFGLQSKKFQDQIEEDRSAGRLEESDDRITRGRIYAIGANAGFVVGGVLGILATYNFIKDPLPESSKKIDEPVEFDDPLDERPTAFAPRRLRSRHADRPKKRKKPQRPPFVVGPAVGERGGGFVIQGTF